MVAQGREVYSKESWLFLYLLAMLVSAGCEIASVNSSSQFNLIRFLQQSIIKKDLQIYSACIYYFTIRPLKTNANIFCIVVPCILISVKFLHQQIHSSLNLIKF